VEDGEKWLTLVRADSEVGPPRSLPATRSFVPHISSSDPTMMGLL
jgi:hypothetical protein